MATGLYIDIHTHGGSPPDGIRMVCLDAGKEENPSGEWFSVGIHPWTLGHTDTARALARVREMARQEKVLALGECGLDLLADADLMLQEEVLREHIAIAEQAGKPLIIHCVKAHNELIRIRHSTRTKVPFIIHGYDNNLAIARQLLQQGFYFSLGKALLKPHSNAAGLIGQCPLERLFLETDDSCLPIADIYAAAARLRKLPLEELQAAIKRNFSGLFGGSVLMPTSAHAAGVAA